MIHIAAQKIAGVLIANGANQEEEVLAYGAECFLNELLCTTLLILIGLFFHQVWGLLIWSVGFCLLRVNLGGIHAPTQGLCIVLGTVLGASSLLIAPVLLQLVFPTAVVSLAAMITAIVIAPVPHKHKQHVQEKRKKIKRKVVGIVILEALSIMLLYVFIPLMAAYLATALLMAVALAVAGVLWNPR